MLSACSGCVRCSQTSQTADGALYLQSSFWWDVLKSLQWTELQEATLTMINFTCYFNETYLYFYNDWIGDLSCGLLTLLTMSRTYGVNMLVWTYVISVILSCVLGTGGSDQTCQKLRIMMDKKSHGVVPRDSHSGKCVFQIYHCGLVSNWIWYSFVGKVGSCCQWCRIERLFVATWTWGPVPKHDSPHHVQTWNLKYSYLAVGIFLRQWFYWKLRRGGNR